MFQFVQTMKCLSTQTIFISRNNTHYRVYIDGNLYYECIYHKTYTEGHDFLLDRLAQNDGFENGIEFMKYFNKSFSGKLIHWTNLKY